MHTLRRAESDQYPAPPESSPTIKQQLFLIDQELLRSGVPTGKGPVANHDREPGKEVANEKAEQNDLQRYEHSKHSTVVFNSLGALKLFQIAFASAVVGCLWSQCRFTYYASGYCYGPASAFQLQNFPIFASLVCIIANLVILLTWITTWEQATPHDFDNKWKRKKVAQVDTMFSFVFVLLHMGSVIVEIWMIMKFNQGYNCPMCYTLALWIIAAACLIVNMALYIYNITLCLQQRRLNSIMRVRF